MCSVRHSEAPSPQLCHCNILVTFEEHQVSLFETIRKAPILPFFTESSVSYSAPLLCPDTLCALSPIHHPRHLLLSLAPAWKCRLTVYCSKESLSFSFLVFCKRRCRLLKHQSCSSQVFSCSAAITYCQWLPSSLWNATEHMLDPQN